eukprot:353509-Chlamydomonas_euryale.AAC.7
MGAGMTHRQDASSVGRPCSQVSYGGEDAHFVSNIGGGAIGVADGVGGWQAEGVNPAGAAKAREEG